MPLTTKNTPVAGRLYRPTWTLLVVTDGRRDYLEQAIRSSVGALPVADRYIVIDDSGDAAWLKEEVGLAFELYAHDERLGMAATVGHAWSLCDTDYIFHLEDDFTFNEQVDIDGMAAVLDANPHLAQMCLLRQPWNAEEIAAGGIIEKDPDDYTDRDGWLEHRRLFSLNPCLIPRRVYQLGWDENNERGFTDRLLALGYSFGYWGKRGDPPRVTHIGRRRAPGWRL